MTTLQAYTAGGQSSLIGSTGFTGLTVAIGSPATKVVVTASSALALIADGSLVTPVTITLTVSTTTGTYYIWLDKSTDGLFSPVWTVTTVATAAPSASAIVVGLATVSGSVVTHVAMMPSGFKGEQSDLKVATATVARTDTTAKDLFALPAGAVIRDFFINVGTASDATSTATVALGTSASSTAFNSGYSVESANLGMKSTSATVTALGPQTNAILVTGVYAETGTASTTGGPFTVYCFYV